MLARNSLIAICALSAGYSLFQGVQSPVPAASAQRAEQGQARKAPVRLLFDPPTPKPVVRQLQKGTVHVYPLPVKAGELVSIIAYQDGVDVQVTVFGADGKAFLTVDSLNGWNGAERLPFVANATATYRIEISSASDHDTGPYRIWIAAEHPATKRDRDDAAAEVLFFQAKTKSPAQEKELRQAVELWKRAGNKVRQAGALEALGQLYKGQPDWKAALPAWRQARDLYHRARDFAAEGRIDNSLGSVYKRHSYIEAAEKNYQQAFLQGQRGGDHWVVASALYNLGVILKERGRAGEALEKLEQSLITGKGLSSSQDAKTLTAMGQIFAEAGELKQAMAEYEKALSLLPRDVDSNNKAYIWIGVAEVYSKRNEQEQARHFYLEALRIQRQNQDEDEMPLSLNGLALTFLNDKRPREAIDPFLKALDLTKREDSPLDQARVLTNLAWTYGVLRQEKEARRAYERALALARGRDSWIEAGVLLGLTRLEEDRRDPIAAQKQAEAAVKCVEGMRAAIGRKLQISFFATKQDVYDALIEVLLWQDRLHPSAGYDARALQVSEQARSRGLLDSVSSFRSKAGRGAEFPIPAILSLPEIQSSVLDPDTLLLEYHLGKSASYLWVVGQNFHQIFQLPPRQQIEELAGRASQLLKSPREEKLYEARRAAEDLSRVVLGPAAYWLGRKRLAISSPAVLQAVPFGVLPDPQVSPAPGGDEPWPRPLIAGHEIIRIPSASVIAAIRARAAGRKPPPNRLAVLSDPVSSAGDDRLTGHPAASPETRAESAIDSLYGRFDRLENARKEAAAILLEAGPRGVWSASGFEVTRELALSGRLSSFRNLHFSMHGYFNEDDGNDSALIFSLFDRHGRRRKGLLPASEIYGLNLPADLVVLSACDTGRGESVPGEGVVGLSQAFLVAGATRVMMSLWNIDDLATSKLMKLFYHEYFANGASPAAALREAQKAMSRSPNRNAPFYWGGFEIQGDWNPTSARR